VKPKNKRHPLTMAQRQTLYHAIRNPETWRKMGHDESWGVIAFWLVLVAGSVGQSIVEACDFRDGESTRDRRARILKWLDLP